VLVVGNEHAGAGSGLSSRLAGLFALTCGRRGGAVVESGRAPPAQSATTTIAALSERDVVSSLIDDDTRARLCEQSARALTLVLPVGRNQDPTAAWSLGCQLVAVDYHSVFDDAVSGREMWIHQGLFAANGHCGYVPRAPYAVDPPPRRAAAVLEVRIICGHGLREVTSDDAGGPEARIDPYVVVSVEGHDIDRATRRTDVVRDVLPGGFSAWDETFPFRLSLPQQALLVLEVSDRDMVTEDDLIGQAVLPVAALREGIRAVGLCDKLGYVIEGCSLTCDFRWATGP
jgi:hypothetical protein